MFLINNLVAGASCLAIIKRQPQCSPEEKSAIFSLTEAAEPNNAKKDAGFLNKKVNMIAEVTVLVVGRARLGSSGWGALSPRSRLSCY